MTWVGGGQRLPSADHGQFQLPLQCMTLTHYAPKLEPARKTLAHLQKHIQEAVLAAEGTKGYVRRYRSRGHVRTQKKRDTKSVTGGHEGACEDTLKEIQERRYVSEGTSAHG